jgi:hypothetical protein
MGSRWEGCFGMWRVLACMTGRRAGRLFVREKKRGRTEGRLSASFFSRWARAVRRVLFATLLGGTHLFDVCVAAQRREATLVSLCPCYQVHLTSPRTVQYTTETRSVRSKAFSRTRVAALTLVRILK